MINAMIKKPNGDIIFIKNVESWELCDVGVVDVYINSKSKIYCTAQNADNKPRTYNIDNTVSYHYVTHSSNVLIEEISNEDGFEEDYDE